MIAAAQKTNAKVGMGIVTTMWIACQEDVEKIIVIIAQLAPLTALMTVA